MAVEGQELDGVVKAIDFLLNVNHGYKVELGKRVLVIGGGFVAFDAARMALVRHSKASRQLRATWRRPSMRRAPRSAQE